MLCWLFSVRASDKRVTGEGEYSDSEDEGEGGGRKDRANYKPKAKRMKTDSEEKKEAGDKGKGLNSKAGDIKSDRLIAKADTKYGKELIAKTGGYQVLVSKELIGKAW